VRCWVHSVLSQYGAYPPPPGHPRIEKELLKAEVAWLARAAIERAYLRICRVKGAAVGFAVLDTDAVHFVYVDKEYRRKGRATELVRDVISAPWYFTTDSMQGSGFVRALPKAGYSEGRFDPYRLYRLFAGDVAPGSDFVGAPPRKEAANGAAREGAAAAAP
jgi:GNAT superfamily N-acetyltransferase